MLEFLITIYTLWNIVTFALYGFDKARAKYDAWRISEKNLLICAFAMGAIGAGLARFVFSHKTLKPMFNFLIPVALVVNYVVLFFLFERVGWPFDALWLLIIFVAVGTMRDFRRIFRNLRR